MRTHVNRWCAGLAALILVPGLWPASAAVATTAAVPVDRNPVPLTLMPVPAGIEMMNGRGDLVGTVTDAGHETRTGEWPRYGEFVDFGTGADTYLHAMNDRGHVVGDDELVFYAAFLWRDGQLTHLALPDTVVWAAAVSNRDQIVGDLSLINGPGLQAFSWRNGTFTRLATPEGLLSYALDVNDRGQVLGMVVDADWSSAHGAVWDHGRLTVIGAPDGPSTMVRAINNRGQVIGFADGRPFLWSGGRMRDLLAGTGATTGFAEAINDNGIVIGDADGRPVVWTGGRMRYVAPRGYGGTARFVNRRGDVAGSVYLDDGTDPEQQEKLLFRWRDGVTTYHGAPEGSRAALYGMDDRGRLVGTVTTADGARQWVTWPGHGTGR